MQEFTVKLANRPGMLASLAEELAAAGVNIEALAGSGVDGEGIVHLVVNDDTATRHVLQQAGIRFEEREVIATLLPHRPGALAEITRELADAGVNIDSVYLLRSSSEGLEFALTVDTVASARAALAS